MRIFQKLNIVIAIFLFGFSPAYFSVSASAVPKNLNSNGLIGYWPLNEGTGTTARDYSGNTSNGTLISSATWATGKFSNAVSLNGTSQYVSVGNPLGANSTTTLGARNFTVSAWFYRTGTGVTMTTGTGGVVSEPIVAKLVGESDGSSKDGNYFLGFRPADGTLVADFEDSNNGLNWPIISTTTSLPNNAWTLGTVVLDGSNMKIYINGVLDNTRSSITQYPRFDSIQRLAIGSSLNSTGGVSGYFKGRIDEVRIYNRPLSASEVLAIYKQGVTKRNANNTLKINSSGASNFNNGLVGYFTMDGKDINWATSRAVDRSGGGNVTNMYNMSNTTSPVIGKIGQALQFNGSNQYFDVTDASSLNPSNVSLSAWVKTSATGGYIIAKDPSSTETLRPNGAGSETAIGAQVPGSGAHWDKVDEAVADDNDIVTANQNADAWYRDLYALPNHTGSGTINSVTVYARMLAGIPLPGDQAGKISIRTQNTTYDTSAYTFSGSWAVYSNVWSTNPNTGSAWTWDEVDALQAGVSLLAMSTGMQSILSGQLVLMADGSQKNIEDLQVGEEIISFDTISGRAEKDKITEVMTGSHDDYLVFNGTLKTSLNHIIWSNGEYKPAEDIRVGDFLLDSYGQTVAVTQIQYVPETVQTYNLEVEKNHNFFVEGYLVHNIVAPGSCSQVYVVVDYTEAPAGKTNAPYALSTVNGGQFLIKSGETSYTVDSSVSVADGKWHHLASTYDSTTMRIFVDGVQTGTGTSFSGNLPTEAGNVRIGADYNTTPGDFFSGSLDDVRIYNRALTSAEILQLYNAGK